jgi:hypothetical protein
MTGLTTLILLWLIGDKRSGAPLWPTAASPPPAAPMAPLPPPPSGDTGTPLADLAQPQPAPTPSAAAPPSDKKGKVKISIPKPLTKLQALRKAKKTPGSIVRRVMKAGPPAPSQTSVSVSSLQAILARKGYPIKKDGLYGPKTASAWQSLADKSALNPMIARVGPKVARVTKDTYTKLSIP